MKILSEVLTAFCAIGLVAAGLIYSSPPPNYDREFGASVLISASSGGAGSGTFITPNKVLTARHVARLTEGITPEVLTVQDINGGLHTVVDAIYPKEKADAAILIVDPPLTTHKVAPVSCRLPFLGEELHNVGNPWGGVLKWFLAKAWVSGYESNYKAIKDSADAIFNGVVLFQGISIGGQSGSALFDNHGNVVGVLVLGMGAPGRDPGTADLIGGFVALSYICDWIEGEVNE